MQEIEEVRRALQKTVRVLGEINKIDEGKSGGLWKKFHAEAGKTERKLKPLLSSFIDYSRASHLSKMEEIEDNMSDIKDILEDAEKTKGVLELGENYEAKHVSKGSSRKSGAEKIDLIDSLEDAFSDLEVEFEDLEDAVENKTKQDKLDFKTQHGLYVNAKKFLKTFLSKAKKIKGYPHKSEYPWHGLRLYIFRQVGTVKTFYSKVKAADDLNEMGEIFNEYYRREIKEVVDRADEARILKVKTRRVVKTDEQKIWLAAKGEYQIALAMLERFYDYIGDAADAISED